MIRSREGQKTRTAALMRALALAAALSTATLAAPLPALADATGETELIVQGTRTDTPEDDERDEGQQRATVTTPASTGAGGDAAKGGLPKTGDDAFRGVAALAVAGGGATAVGIASRRRRGTAAQVAQGTAGAHAAQQP